MPVTGGYLCMNSGHIQCQSSTFSINKALTVEVMHTRMVIMKTTLKIIGLFYKRCKKEKKLYTLFL